MFVDFTEGRTSPGAMLRGRPEQEWRGRQIDTFGGGANEIQRESVAMLGLGRPPAALSAASAGSGE